MTKYLPKDSGYTQMYLINKFEKNIMENTLSNMKNDQKNGEEMNALKKFLKKLKPHRLKI